MTEPDASGALPAIDHAHLSRQTGGDGDLARELLGLFDGQCAALAPGIADAGRPAAERADLAHTLKGSAAGIGAEAIRGLCGRIEDDLRRSARAGEADLAALAEAVAAARAEIARSA